MNVLLQTKETTATSVLLIAFIKGNDSGRTVLYAPSMVRIELAATSVWRRSVRQESNKQTLAVSV